MRVGVNMSSIFLFLLLNAFLIHNAASFDIFKDILIGLIKCDCNDVPEGLDVSKLKLTLYNMENDAQETYDLNQNTLSHITSRPDFNALQCVHVFAHGFEETTLGVLVDDYKCAFQNLRCESNSKPLALFVDYSDYSTFLPVIGYSTAYSKLFRRLRSISNALGNFLVGLSGVVSKKNIVLSGHGTGGHLVGLAAQRFKLMTGGKLPAVYAIDPAGPCYDKCPGSGVQSGQADNVVTFHCNAGTMGSNLNVSDYDFFSHDGVYQMKSSWLLTSLSSIASHYKCPPIVLQTLVDPSVWTATMCNNYEDYKNERCEGNIQTLAGYNVRPESRPGVYYFEPSGDLQCDFSLPKMSLSLIWKYVRLPFNLWPFGNDN